MSYRRPEHDDRNIFLSAFLAVFGWMGRLVGIILASGIAGGVIGGGVALYQGAPILIGATIGAVIGIVLALVVLFMAHDTW